MKYAVATIILVTLVWAAPLFTAMSGGDYSIPADGFSISVGSAAAGGDYTLEASSGEIGAGSALGGSSEIVGGFAGVTGGGSINYSLSKSAVSLNFGSTPLSTVASDSVVLTVTADALTGYAATITESGNLAAGANDINDVADGTVSAGSEEYGIRTSGNDGQLSSDTAIGGTVMVARSLVPVSQSRTTVTFRAAAAQSTLAGIYSHTVTFTVTANP